MISFISWVSLSESEIIQVSKPFKNLGMKVQVPVWVICFAFSLHPALLTVSELRSWCFYLSLSLPPSLLCLSLSLSPSSSLTSVKCNWRSSLHMAHRHGGDIVCAVAANCSPCSSEPIPLPFTPLLCLNLLLLSSYCPSSHLFITLSSLVLTHPRCLTHLCRPLLLCLQQV